MNKIILVTGASGFIGRNLICALAKNINYQIIALSRQKCENLEHSSFSKIPSVQYIQADLCEEDFVAKTLFILQHVDIIIHLASEISLDNSNQNIIDVNCSGILKIAQLARETKCKKIIYLSSVPIVGETKFLPIDEEHGVNPKTLYHASKLFGEHLLHLLAQENINSIILRIPSPIGADMPSNKFFPYLVEKCLKNEDIVLAGQGGRIQNYIDIADIIQAIEKSMEYNRSNLFIIGGRKSYSNLELAKKCKKVLCSQSNILFNGKKDKEEDDKWILSLEKAKNELSYEPYISIEKSILNRKKYYENTYS